MNPITKETYARVTAPMVGQSDLPWRILCRRYGATLTCKLLDNVVLLPLHVLTDTQMFIAEKLLRDEEYRCSHLFDLETGWTAPLGRPVVAQLAGNDPDTVLSAAKIIEPFCDAVSTSPLSRHTGALDLNRNQIDLNLGCPQDHAKEGHYGGYLILAKRDWPRIKAIGESDDLQLPSPVGYLTLDLTVSNLSSNLSIPIHVKLRLCNPPSLTPSLAVLLARAGASVVTLHARHVASRHRRKGAAELKWVQAVKSAILEESGLEDVVVLSNGNVRTHKDCEKNLRETGADGVMVGEALLGNPR